MNPLITTRELAQLLGKPSSWLLNNASRMGIPRYRVGNQWRYRMSEIEAWLEQKAAPSGGSLR